MLRVPSGPGLGINLDWEGVEDVAAPTGGSSKWAGPLESPIQMTTLRAC